MTVEAGTRIEAIEQALCQHRAFGDSAYIQGQLRASLNHRLERIATQLPVAGDLLEAIEQSQDSVHRLVGNTVVRCAILHAHTQVETGAPHGLPLSDCEEVFAATLDHVRQGKTDIPLQDGSLPRLGAEPYLGWVWSEEHSDDIFGHVFRYLVGGHYGALPCTPSSKELSTLNSGIRLLQELLPSLTPSALSHALLVGCIPSASSWTGTASGSQFNLGGTIFISRALGSPWWVAEHLLHEAVHQKLYDFRHGHSLMRLDYARESTPRVWSPWNPQRLHKANYWDAHRVYAAFHVYVHVALLAMVAERRAEELETIYGPYCGMTESRKALDRAHYLGENLRNTCSGQLGLAGAQMADWLSSVLEFLDQAPPPKGSYAHLCLDLYMREANQVAHALDRNEPVPPTLAQELAPLAKEEVRTTCRVLVHLDAQEVLRSLDAAVDRYPDDLLGARFPEVRRAITTALIDASPDGYRLGERGDDLVRQMVEASSESLYSILAGYPPAVADAKRRARELKFPSSCHDDVGRLLAVLAAAVPVQGRVLEIGTGAGVGTAWIADGLGARSDVEVISIECDQRLSNATRAWPWPSQVRIETADVEQTLGNAGTFNLVFADAAPFKYDHIEDIVSSLRPGGFLVVDDVGATARTTDQQRAEIDAFRRRLLRHPELRAVEIQWATGVILATRIH